MSDDITTRLKTLRDAISTVDRARAALKGKIMAITESLAGLGCMSVKEAQAEVDSLTAEVEAIEAEAGRVLDALEAKYGDA